MDDRELKKLLKEDMEMEADSIIELVNSDPSLDDVEVPETLHDKIFQQIREIEEENARNKLSEKDKELVRLGKKYKKSRRMNAYIIIAAAVICALAVGVTAMGGPEKVFRKLEDMVAGKEQTYVDTDGARTGEIKAVSEVEAYEKINEEFGVYPVSFDYLPDRMKYIEMSVSPDIQTAQLIYENDDDGVIKCRMNFNYRTSSVGSDVEDSIIEEYNREVAGVTINVEKYLVEEAEIQRWNVKFEYQDVWYTLLISGVDEVEVDNIIENLYFPKK